MKPGLEMDKLIHDKIMHPHLDPEQVDLNDATFQELLDAMARLIYPPKYSTSISHAWEVVEKIINETGFEIVFWSFNNGNKYVFQFIEKEGISNIIKFTANGDNLHHAICLAALKAKGVEIDS